MLTAQVIVDIPARALDRAFDYAVPEKAGRVEVGCAVSVEFGSRPVVGYIVGLGDATGTKATYTEATGGESGRADGIESGCADDDLTPTLKPILGVLSDPYFDEAAAKLIFWIAREYLSPLSDALHLFTPPGGSPKIKRRDGDWELVYPGAGPVDDRWVFPTDTAATFVPAKNASKQRAVLASLRAGGMRVAELAIDLGAIDATIKSLEKKGVVHIERRRRIRGGNPAPKSHSCDIDELTQGQKDALAAIAACAKGTATGSQKVVVVDGITGSGKTEVYLRAISDVLAAGKGAIVLVPEIALTPQTLGRFRSRFGDDVAVLHSRLSAGERYDQWDLVRQGAVHVVVGTRSALFAPLANLGLVVIDEEHEATYKQESAPRYAARDVALALCELRGATLVLGSATPSIDTLASCEGGCIDGRSWSRVVLPERPCGLALPPVTVVDMGKEFTGGSRSMFSKELVDALMQVYERKEKAVMMLNRRGFASFVLCRECGFVPQCPDCAVSLTYHERGNYLACHHCGHRQPNPGRCPSCGSPYLRKFGTGTERVEAELAVVLPDDMPIVRMDADTVQRRGKGGHASLLEEFESLDCAVLLGTQMIAKGLDFPEVTLVGVINADTTLRLPDFRASERTFQLLEQVSGRAGRAERPGRVIVQTYWPDHPAIRAAASHDRRIFLDNELPLRSELGYPPFVRLANVLVWGKKEAPVKSEASKLALALKAAIESAGLSWTLLGPAPCLLGRLRGFYRWHILIKAPYGADIACIAEPILKKRKKGKEDVRVAVDVDPFDLF